MTKSSTEPLDQSLRQAYDRRSVLGYCVGGAAGVVLLGTARPSQAATTNFKATMNGATEVPPNQSTGSGTVTAAFDPTSKVLTWEGSFSGLTGPATAAHFHGPAEPGKNAGVAIWISEKGKTLDSPFKGSATLTDAQASDLQAGLMYVNVHTAANPGGELRGQLVKQ
jgi:CHRD domain